MSRYVLHPGEVVSRNDAQRHFVGVGQLRRLYNVPPTAEVVVGDTWGFRPRPDDIHCRPRFDGDYPMFELGGEA